MESTPALLNKPHQATQVTAVSTAPSPSSALRQLIAHFPLTGSRTAKHPGASLAAAWWCVQHGMQALAGMVKTLSSGHLPLVLSSEVTHLSAQTYRGQFLKEQHQQQRDLTHSTEAMMSRTTLDR